MVLVGSTPRGDTTPTIVVHVVPQPHRVMLHAHIVVLLHAIIHAMPIIVPVLAAADVQRGGGGAREGEERGGA